MSDQPLANTPQPAILTEIVLVPLEDEDDDFVTVSAVEDVTVAVLNDTIALQNYTAKLASDNSRSTGVILLLGEIAHQAIAQKDLIIAFLQAGTAAIGALAKQRRVNKIEMSLDGDSISIENPDTATVQTLLELFEAKHPGIVAKVTPSSKLQVTGKVSKYAGERQHLFEVLDTIQYGQAKMHDDPSTRSYAYDLDLGLQAAAWEGWTVEEGIALLPRLWQYTL